MRWGDGEALAVQAFVLVTPRILVYFVELLFTGISGSVGYIPVRGYISVWVILNYPIYILSSPQIPAYPTCCRVKLLLNCYERNMTSGNDNMILYL